MNRSRIDSSLFEYCFSTFFTRRTSVNQAIKINSNHNFFLIQKNHHEENLGVMSSSIENLLNLDFVQGGAAVCGRGGMEIGQHLRKDYSNVRGFLPFRGKWLRDWGEVSKREREKVWLERFVRISSNWCQSR
ncbi:hypothetical protein CEXT_419861 [Caerostris extrusa]|uniref:Uncharacterized protein n=1 Tax=Caerostris extrusa TaxID=172846 RepID=A0AAV4SFD3_CAEEX|nr:hypothetical protein CEXT_419861 [Caerostris extrusa]